MRYGSAWYPEHWPEERWPTDLGLMREAGMNVVRIGEFAWSRIEPEEGRFELDWLERAVDGAAEQGLDTVLGTPSAAPPAWLTARYPDTLAVREDGRRAQHGNRCHFSPTSARYVELAARVAEAMARRLGSHPRVIGWQIDNEYSSISYDEEARTRFQAWLLRRYASIQALNERWTTAYWSQEYSDFSQIPLPVGGHNPSLRLEFRRFVSEVYAAYQRAQIAVIRRYSRLPITHNFMGFFDAFDHYVVARDLDFASWDSYVGTGHLDAARTGATHDLTRGFLRKNFWLMETQPGNVNWEKVNNSLDRGEVRAMAFHAVLHGADAVLFWQWRSALGGQEQYHGSILAADGRPRPLYREVQELGADLARAATVLAGTSIRADTALIHGYDDRWAIGFQRHHHEFDPVAHLLAYYAPLRRLSAAVDIVSPAAPFDGYRLILAPGLHLMDDELAERLATYVRNGGHLVLGARSAMKNRDNALLASRQPGPLAALTGAHVEEYYALDAAVPLEGGGSARLWAEWLEPDASDCEVLLRYAACNGWLDGQAAVVSRAVGAGRVSYVGTWLDDATLAALVRRFAEQSGIDQSQAALPDGVELGRRTGPNGEVRLLVNHTREAKRVALAGRSRDVLAEETLEGEVTLAPRAVRVLVDP